MREKASFLGNITNQASPFIDVGGLNFLMIEIDFASSSWNQSYNESQKGRFTTSTGSNDDRCLIFSKGQ